MSWAGGFWQRLLRKAPPTSLQGLEFRHELTLYSVDGQRAAEVLCFKNGATYLRDLESNDGQTFAVRHAGNLVGPFGSADAAERFIVATEWFNGSPE